MPGGGELHDNEIQTLMQLMKIDEKIGNYNTFSDGRVDPRALRAQRRGNLQI